MQHSGAEPEGSSHDLTPLRTREATSAATGKRKGGQEESDAADISSQLIQRPHVKATEWKLKDSCSTSPASSALSRCHSAFAMSRPE